MPNSDHPLFLQGIALFNDRQFFECHEVLETLWNQEEGDKKQLTQGLIQLAVGYYHLLRDNRLGASKLLKKAYARLQPLAPNHSGLKLDSLLLAVEKTMSQLEKDDSVDCMATGIPSIHFVSNSKEL